MSHLVKYRQKNRQSSIRPSKMVFLLFCNLRILRT